MKVYAKQPGDSKALQLKCICLNDLGRFQDALDTIEAMANPGEQDARTAAFTLMGKGYAFMGLARYDESVRSFD